MKTRHEIRRLLVRLDRAYLRRSRNPEIQLYIAKICALEACGWIEEILDEFYARHSQRMLIAPQYRKLVDARVRRIYSFEYEKHIRAILECLAGLQGVERLETNVDQKSFFPMKAALSSLKKARDDLAHTHIKGIQTVIDAPSVTIARFDEVTRGLRHCNVVFKRLTS